MSAETIYLVEQYGYDHATIVGVFADREKAEAHKRRWRRKIVYDWRHLKQWNYNRHGRYSATYRGKPHDNVRILERQIGEKQMPSDSRWEPWEITNPIGD